MSKIVKGTKASPVDADTLIIADSEDGGKLKEILFSNLGVDSIVLTSQVGAIDTYTMYSDSTLTKAIGTFDIRNGSDGTGTTLPMYSDTVTYGINDRVRDVDGLQFISLEVGNINNTPPRAGDVHWVRDPSTRHKRFRPTGAYVRGEVVSHNSVLYVATEDILSGTPHVIGGGPRQWTIYEEGHTLHREELVTVNTRRWYNGVEYEANKDIGIGVPFVEGLIGDTWKRVGIPDALHFMSIHAVAADAIVVSDVVPGTVVGYYFEGTVASKQQIIDPFSMLTKEPNAGQNLANVVMVRSTGYYSIDVQYGCQVNTGLQELAVAKNWNQRSNPSVVVPLNLRLLHLNFPGNAGVSSPRLPISASCIVHLILGEGVSIVETGVSLNNLEGLKFSMKQINTWGAP